MLTMNNMTKNKYVAKVDLETVTTISRNSARIQTGDGIFGRLRIGGGQDVRGIYGLTVKSSRSCFRSHRMCHET